MNKTRAAIALLVLSLLLLSPLTMGESEALSNEDVVVNIPDAEYNSDGEVYIEAVSGSSTQFEIYVTNCTSEVLNIHAKSADLDGSLSVRTDIDKGLISPDGTGLDSIATITVTLSVENYAENHTGSGKIVLTVTDMGTNANPDDKVVVIDVPINVKITSAYSNDDSYNKFFGIIPNTLGEPLNSTLFTAAVSLIIWMIVTIAIAEIVIPIFTRLVGTKMNDADKTKLRSSMTKVIAGLMALLAIRECADIMGAGVVVVSFLDNVVNVISPILFAIILWQAYVFVITAILNGLGQADIDGLDNSLLPLFKMLGKMVLAIGSVAFILSNFGVDLGGILVSAGVISLGITLGAQETLNQFFSGIVLLSTRPFRAGDFITMNGETYIVHKVKLMFTEFENWDKDRIITIPNNVVSKATLINHTRGTPNTRIFIYVSVAYDANLTLAKELMIQAAKMHPHTVLDHSVIGPSTRLTAFQDSGIEYRLAVFVDDFDNSAHYAGQIREIIYKLFLDNGVSIPYNRLEVTLLDPCDGKKKSSDVEPD